MKSKYTKILHQLKSENLAKNLQKREFVKAQITWLGFTVTPHRKTPTKQKSKAIIKLEFSKKKNKTTLIVLGTYTSPL